VLSESRAEGLDLGGHRGDDGADQLSGLVDEKSVFLTART
jgi:hypothetical protein